MPNEETSRRIRAARIYAGMSRSELAGHLEVSERTQVNTELGLRHVPRPELLAIAEACEVPMWFLEGGWEGWRTGDDRPREQPVDQAARAALADLDRRRSAETRKRKSS